MLYSAYRTAICKAKRGSFKDTHPEDLLAPVLKVCNRQVFRGPFFPADCKVSRKNRVMSEFTMPCNVMLTFCSDFLYVFSDEYPL